MPVRGHPSFGGGGETHIAPLMCASCLARAGRTAARTEHLAERRPASEPAPLHRFDSAAARGFSSTVAFVRKEAVAAHLAPDWSNALAGAEETLEESWERMQRSVASGKAQRMPVEMDMQVTDG